MSSQLSNQLKNNLFSFVNNRKITFLKASQDEILTRLDPLVVLARWVQFYLSQAGINTPITNFNSDFQDCSLFYYLVTQLFPEVDWTAVGESDSLQNRIESFISTITNKTLYRGFVPKKEDLLEGNQEAIITFLVKLATYRPVVDHKRIKKHFNTQKIQESKTMETSKNNSLEIKKEEEEEDQNGEIEDFEGTKFYKIQMKLEKEEESLKNINFEFFPDIDLILKEEQTLSYPSITQIMENAYNGIDESYLEIPFEQEEDLITKIRNLIDNNEKAKKEIIGMDEKLKNLEFAVKSEQQKFVQKEDEQKTNEIEKRVIDLSNFCDQSDLFVQNFSLFTEKIPILGNNIDECFDFKGNQFLALAIASLKVFSTGIIFNSTSAEEKLLESLFELLKNQGIEGVDNELKNIIGFRIESIKWADVEGIITCRDFVITTLKDSKKINYDQKQAELGIKNMFHYYLFVKLFKLKLAEYLINDVLLQTNIIKIADGLIESILVAIVEIFHSFMLCYIDFPSVTQSFESLLRAFQVQQCEQVAELLVTKAKKDALGETLRMISLSILTDEQTNLVHKSLQDLNDPDTETPIFDLIFKESKEFLGPHLNDDDIAFLAATIDPNNCRDSINDIATDVYNIIETMGLAIPLIQMAILQGVFRTSSAGSLFRANDVATKLITKYALLHGMEYLYDCLSGVIKEITECGLEFEVDPNKFMPEELDGVDLDQNMKNLRFYFNKILDSIFRSVENAPVGFRIIANSLMVTVSRKFPDNVVSSIGGFIFLRFICPSIVSPKTFGLIEEHPRGASLRGLLLISTAVQALSNGITFSKNRIHMQKINEDITRRFGERRDFLFRLAKIEGVKTDGINTPYIENHQVSFENQLKEVFTPALLKKLSTENQINQDNFVEALILTIYALGSKNTKEFLSSQSLRRITNNTQKNQNVLNAIKELGSKLEKVEKYYPQILQMAKMQKMQNQSNKTSSQQNLNKPKVPETFESLKNKFLQSNSQITRQATVNFGIDNGNQKIKDWKKRVIVLKDSRIALFTKSANKPEGLFDIIVFDKRSTIHNGTYKKKNTLAIKFKDEIKVFSFDKSKELDDWNQEIQKLL
ncbi:ras gtpase-activating protein [Anaeramoeba flamelloides]|uniref:Ras gtpase-activating protein n=1 Tax=Anaeramoeba flamelloides TaxID=1746091 RepID=A0ABQ8YDR0_9EUKA|nr:ras gtpase-activating protein [Anaeramoeba flamelloides]